MARDATTKEPRERVAAEAAASAPPTADVEVGGEVGDDLGRVVEAMLFAAHEALSSRRIARAIGFVSEARIDAVIAELARRHDAQQSPLMVAEIAGGWRLVTRPEYAPFLARLFSKAEKERLSQAALETLAIVAYRQPATRAEIEAVRGVLVGPLLRLLQERRLIKVVGRAEVVGRALQYGTTRRFLDHFGLGSIADLPKVFPMGRSASPAEEAAAPEAGGANPGDADAPAAAPPVDSGASPADPSAPSEEPAAFAASA